MELLGKPPFEATPKAIFLHQTAFWGDKVTSVSYSNDRLKKKLFLFNR